MVVRACRIAALLACALPYLSFCPKAEAQSGAITGTVVDPSGAAIPKAAVEIQNPVSAYTRMAETDNFGRFQFSNVPLNPYHLTVKAAGFNATAQDVDVKSTVPADVKIVLAVAGSSTSVTVQAGGGDLVETTPVTHTDVDRALFDKMPLESQSSGLSSLVTLASPGVTADSNGLFHGLGDHAENSFSLDGQPITDQQSKVFSNQIPVGAVQSMEVIPGAPPAEYGDKTSLIVVVATRSGQGVTTPHGDVTASYGSFGTTNAIADLAYGGNNWGNYISASGLDTGRFLDAPEFAVMHDKGNEENVFDRADYQFSANSTAHLNLGYTRSWFQNPNSYDQLNNGVIGPNGLPVGQADQRSQIRTYNIAPTWTKVINPATVFTVTAYTRKDEFNYYPSNDPFADLGPPGLQRESAAQARSLNNLGGTASLSYANGTHNIKAGITYNSTFLTENDNLGIVDPTLNAPCLSLGAVPVPGFSDPSQCPGGLQPNISSNPNAPNTALYPLFNPVLAPYDMTRGGRYYNFYGHTDVKELGLYVQDAITLGNWSFNVGLRGDLYNGLTSASQAEPRLGIAYKIKPSSTVLRISYARALETPFNENLIVSSTGCNYPVLAALMPCVPAVINPGFRNEFHAGLSQAFGKYLVIDGEYLWKYTHNAYDFADLGNTPIFFPIEWNHSKITGFTLRASMPDYHGLSAQVVMSSVAARFFTPQVGGLGTIPVAANTGSNVFRIDHDEVFNETFHLQYQPWKRGPWIGFNWRFDSGMVAGAIPCFAATTTCAASSTLLNGQPAILPVDNNVGGVPLTPDQQFQAGLYCGSIHASPTRGIPSPCLASQFGSTLIRIPALGTENDDHNPQRVLPRSLFDLSVGDDDLFHTDRYKWSLRLTAVNLTNEYALYNFLSTFSGTHYVTPRALTAELGFHF